MKGFTTIKIFLVKIIWNFICFENLMQPLILCLLSPSDKCVNFIYHTNCLASLSTVAGIEISLNAYIANIKYHNLCTDPPSEHVSTAVTKVRLRRVISHNSSQMDSPEIKSASQTAS